MYIDGECIMAGFLSSEIYSGWTGFDTVNYDWKMFKYKGKILLIAIDFSGELKKINSSSNDSNYHKRHKICESGPFRNKAIELDSNYHWALVDEKILFNRSLKGLKRDVRIRS